MRAALEDHYDVYVAEDGSSAMNLLEQENFVGCVAESITGRKLQRLERVDLIPRLSRMRF